MPIRIIDNQKVDLTEDEYKAYISICEAYDKPPAQRGRDPFTDLFQTNDDGIIVFLKPSHTRMCCFEVFLFMMSIMTNQHLRLAHKKIDDLCAKVDLKLSELQSK